MAAARQPDQEGTDDGNLQSSLQDSNQAEIARALGDVLCMTEFQSRFEPVIRRLVQEEVSSFFQRLPFHRSCRTTLHQTERFGARAFQLCFMNKLPSNIYSFSNLTAEDGAPIQIALCDATSQHSIVTNAPQSSMKIEICPLDGEFSSNDWTANEFNAQIVRERENKGPLLKGDKFVILQNGIGSIRRIMFTDNSSWTRSREFRIGAKFVDSAEARNIREGRSDPFRVKDSRGEAYKKHDRPSLNDPVWRLNKIAKNGKFHKHLSSPGINIRTVKDVLHLHTNNPVSFEQIFSCIPRKSTEAIIEHAKASRDLDDMYQTEGRQPLVPESELSPSNDFMAIDEPSPNSSMDPLATTRPVRAAAQSSNPDQGLQQFVSFQQETWGFLSQPSMSTLRIGDAVNDNQVRTEQQSDWIGTQLNISIDEDFLTELLMDGNNACVIADSQNPFSSDPFASIGNGSHSEAEFCGHASSSRSTRKKLWRKIRNVLKCFRLYAATRNRTRLFPIPHNY